MRKMNGAGGQSVTHPKRKVEAQKGRGGTQDKGPESAPPLYFTLARLPKAKDRFFLLILKKEGDLE